VEINSHGLFSKWFSESGKLVVKMFQKIQELIDDPEALICILMDEVTLLCLLLMASVYTEFHHVFPCLWSVMNRSMWQRRRNFISILHFL